MGIPTSLPHPKPFACHRSIDRTLQKNTHRKESTTLATVQRFTPTLHPPALFIRSRECPVLHEGGRGVNERVSRTQCMYAVPNDTPPTCITSCHVMVLIQPTREKSGDTLQQCSSRTQCTTLYRGKNKNNTQSMGWSAGSVRPLRACCTTKKTAGICIEDEHASIAHRGDNGGKLGAKKKERNKEPPRRNKDKTSIKNRENTNQTFAKGPKRLSQQDMKEPRAKEKQSKNTNQTRQRTKTPQARVPDAPSKSTGRQAGRVPQERRRAFDSSPGDESTR